MSYFTVCFSLFHQLSRKAAGEGGDLVADVGYGGAFPEHALGERPQGGKLAICHAVGRDDPQIRIDIEAERQRLFSGRSERLGRWPSRVWMTCTPAARAAASTRCSGSIGARVSEMS